MWSAGINYCTRVFLTKLFISICAYVNNGVFVFLTLPVDSLPVSVVSPRKLQRQPSIYQRGHMTRQHSLLLSYHDESPIYENVTGDSKVDDTDGDKGWSLLEPYLPGYISEARI